MPQGITLIIAVSLRKKIICFSGRADFISSAISVLPCYII